MELLSLFCVVIVLVSYALSERVPELFDWANMLCFIPIMYVAMTKGAYAAASINLVFGIIAICKIIRKYIIL